jgi:hypothetical protein
VSIIAAASFARLRFDDDVVVDGAVVDEQASSDARDLFLPVLAPWWLPMKSRARLLSRRNVFFSAVRGVRSKQVCGAKGAE